MQERMGSRFLVREPTNKIEKNLRSGRHAFSTRRAIHGDEAPHATFEIATHVASTAVVFIANSSGG
jgi:hypothetical protein